MNKWLVLLVGLILIVSAVAIVINFSSWRQATVDILKGGLIWVMVLVGLLSLLLAIAEIKDS